MMSRRSEHLELGGVTALMLLLSSPSSTNYCYIKIGISLKSTVVQESYWRRKLYNNTRYHSRA
jgi:hypothetical protein